MTQPQSPAVQQDATQFDATVRAPDDSIPGRFVWHDLMTTDPARAVDFYGKLFGWTTTEMDMGPAGKYTMLHNGGEGVGGVVPLEPGGEHKPHWVCYVTVPNVDAAVERAGALGGSAVVPPMDIPEVGRFAVIADPAGAYISPFTALPGQESPPATYPVGQFCWYELLAPDPEGAARFYKEIFGWTHRTEDMGPYGSYYLLSRGDKDLAGMMQMPADATGPSQWLPYVRVADVDASAARVTELGGTLYVQPKDIPNVGRFAVCADPTGAAIALYKPLMDV